MHQETACTPQNHALNAFLTNPAPQLAIWEAERKKKVAKATANTIEQIMNPFGKTDNQKPVIEDDEMLRERVPPHKAATGWDSPEQKERILKARKRWKDIRIQQEEQTLAL